MTQPTGTPRFAPIALSAESTVVAEHVPEAVQATAYQSEAALEREFIKLLQSQAYEYLPLTSEPEFIANLRTQLEALNNITFSDVEWARFFMQQIEGANEGPGEKNGAHPGGPRSAAQARRRLHQERAAHRQGEHPQQPAAGHQPVRGIELIKQVEINVDYILLLVEKYRAAHGDGDDKEIRASIGRAIDASPSLRNKKDLIEAFVDSVSAKGEIDEEWRAFIRSRRETELEAIIAAEALRPEQTRAFVERAFRDGALQATGTAITEVLPPVSRFSPDGGHGEKKQRVLAKLGLFFERFFGLGSD